MYDIKFNEAAVSLNRGWDNTVNIATRYRTDGSGFEIQWRRGFPGPFRVAQGPIHPPVQWVPALFPELVSRLGKKVTPLVLPFCHVKE
jgi:hypothetical protein